MTLASDFYKIIEQDTARLSIIAGPCAFEGVQHAYDVAGAIQEAVKAAGLHNWCYKTSFDKANRTSTDSYRGKGFDEAQYAFSDVEKTFNVPVLTDIHEAWHCEVTTASILQIPAFLCRQTDLIAAAAGSGKPVNIKKGQFLSPQEAAYIALKFEAAGGKELMLTERGTTFGYNNLVVDMRSLDIMRESEYPIVMDCTHAAQYPGGNHGVSGGNRKMAEVIARAAVGVGINGLFLECHQDPDNAPSDGPNMIHTKRLKSFLTEIAELDFVRKKWMFLDDVVVEGSQTDAGNGDSSGT